MTSTDEDLMAAYRDGDAAAFEALYRRHRGGVYRYVHRLMQGRHDPDAAYQEVWLRVVQRRAQWSAQRPFKPWLYTIAHNVSIDLLRQQQRRPDTGEDDVEALPTPTHDAARWQFIRDCVERLLALVGELPEAQRSAFLLKEEAGLSLAQIGAVVDAGRETVKSRLRYALDRLRRGLEDCEDA
jgi:RNA polymerase sigma-70 factor (ECF subfamily)